MTQLLGIRRYPQYVYCVFDKDEYFLDGFRSLLSDLGFDVSNHPGTDDLGQRLINTGLTDKHFFYKNKECIIDLIFGDKNIFLIINTLSDMRDIITRGIFRFCSL